MKFATIFHPVLPKYYASVSVEEYVSDLGLATSSGALADSPSWGDPGLDIEATPWSVIGSRSASCLLFVRNVGFPLTCLSTLKEPGRGANCLFGLGGISSQVIDGSTSVSFSLCKVFV